MKQKVSFELELKKHNYPGKYISIEGNEGSGKTTQAHELVRKLNENSGSAVYPDQIGVYTKEPTDGEIGQFIREILGGQKKFDPYAFQYLFVADRIEHQKEVERMLAQGKIIISDRSLWSSVVYGAVDKKIDFKNSNEADILLAAYGILSPYNRFMIPDKTFYLSVPPEISMARLTAERHAFEIYDEKEKLSNIAIGYDWLVKRFPEEFHVIDGTKSIEEVSDELLNRIQNIIGVEKT